MEKKQLTAKERKEIFENFDSEKLLVAVEQIDKLRVLFNDLPEKKQPEIREDLVALHTLVFNAITKKIQQPNEMQIWSKAYYLENVLDEAREAIDQISEILTELLGTLPRRAANII